MLISKLFAVKRRETDPVGGFAPATHLPRNIQFFSKIQERMLNFPTLHCRNLQFSDSTNGWLIESNDFINGCRVVINFHKYSKLL